MKYFVQCSYVHVTYFGQVHPPILSNSTSTSLPLPHPNQLHLLSVFKYPLSLFNLWDKVLEGG